MFTSRRVMDFLSVDMFQVLLDSLSPVDVKELLVAP